ncbi:hypothetical protein BB559_000952 [Furculomyces boomerangus]|uniref:Arrestin-like N-terminal domain-containing protein n=1 Tax=Furculomyces boomerangus TaxID=61424 RepID=A0A2T9Z3P5_9FUNG|nr:hypothetical protein BB559_000952 [Furculomyces boomerangus]
MFSGFFSQVTLDLVLQSDTIVFHGNQDSASSKLLFGKVVLKALKRTKISSLKVISMGKTEFSFIERSKPMYSTAEVNRDMYSSGKLQVLDKTEILLDGKKNLIYLDPGTYEYSFIITLPGDLPESVCSTHGSTEYSLKAVLETSSYLSAPSKQIPIYLGRIPYSGPPTFMPADGPNEIKKEFAEKLSVKLNTPSKYYAENQAIDLVADISLINPNINILSIGARMNENITIKSFANPDIKKDIVKLITSGKKEFETNPKSKFLDSSEFNLELCLPQSYKDMQHDIENKTFSVSHQIHFDITIEIEGITQNIVVSLPILVVPNEYFSEMLSLPKYSPKIQFAKDGIITPPEYSEF